MRTEILKNLKTEKPEITAIILAKNGENLISDCLKSISWVKEVIVIDNGCTDKTVEIAKKFGAKIFKSLNSTFSGRRNLGAEKASGEWLLYVDVDERVTPELRNEIEAVVNRKSTIVNRYAGFAIPRRNILLGHEMRHGGWWPDYVLRLIRKDSLITWEGELHEQPQIKGEVGKLKEPLIHRTHRTLTEMVDKTNAWSEIEARLLFEGGHPKMEWWRFFSVAAREFWFRGIKEVGFLDGPVGIIEIIYQMFSRMITYAKLWELQLKDTNIRIRANDTDKYK